MGNGARSAARQALDLAELEDDLKDWVIELAQRLGWRVVHFRPARTTRSARGWATVYDGDRGFPDLVLARDGVIIVAELKAQRGTFGPGQREWLAALGDRAVVWRPGDRDEILAVLRAPRPT